MSSNAELIYRSENDDSKSFILDVFNTYNLEQEVLSLTQGSRLSKNQIKKIAQTPLPIIHCLLSLIDNPNSNVISFTPCAYFPLYKLLQQKGLAVAIKLFNEHLEAITKDVTCNQKILIILDHPEGTDNNSTFEMINSEIHSIIENNNIFYLQSSSTIINSGHNATISISVETSVEELYDYLSKYLENDSISISFTSPIAVYEISNGNNAPLAETFLRLIALTKLIVRNNLKIIANSKMGSLLSLTALSYGCSSIGLLAIDRQTADILEISTISEIENLLQQSLITRNFTDNNLANL